MIENKNDNADYTDTKYLFGVIALALIVKADSPILDMGVVAAVAFFLWSRFGKKSTELAHVSPLYIENKPKDIINVFEMTNAK